MKTFFLAILLSVASLCSATVNTCAGSFNTGTGAAASTVAVSFVNCPTFAPAFIIFTTVGLTNTSNASSLVTNMRHSIGFATSTISRAFYMSSTDANVATTVANSGWRNDGVLGTISSAGAVECEEDMTATSTSGFTMTVLTQCPASLTVMYYAVGGNEITSAAIQVFARGVSAQGARAYTLSLSNPDFIMFLGGGSALSATPPSIAAGACETIGFYTPANQIYGFGSSKNGNTGSSSFNVNNQGAVFAYCTAANGTTAGSVGIASVSGTTLTMQWQGSGVNSTEPFIVLEVKGGNWKVDSFVASHTQSTVTSYAQAFPHKGGMFLTAGNPTYQPAGTATFEHVYGFLDQNLNQFSQCAKDIGAGSNPTKAALGVSFSDVAYRIESGGTIGIEYPVTSIDTFGFTGNTLVSNTVGDQLTWFWLVGSNQGSSVTKLSTINKLSTIK